ncbi:hypothetical protein KPL71_026156 [Citrus sinensis]|uniref:Uncharacterized protein n=1 Tax=Citrus sinensis TaxID=2711 RepID=A0ACB8HXN3_CITSI|nr:hypothetical protein KPL71_026156 [Citrus sinensis]
MSFSTSLRSASPSNPFSRGSLSIFIGPFATSQLTSGHTASTLGVVALDSSIPPEHAAEPLDESIKLSQSDSFVPIKEEIQECSITPTENGVTLNASLMLQANKSNHSETIKLTNGNAEDSNSSPDCLTLEAGHAAYKKIMSSFDLKSASKEETKEPGFTTNDKNVIQNLSLKTAGKRRHNLDMIKVQAKGGFCDVNQKLCDFAQKAARKRRIKESKLTLTGKIDSLSSSSSSGAEGNRKPFEKMVKVERVSPTYNEHSALPSLLGLQDKERREATKAPFEKIVKVERVSPTDNENFALPSLLELQDEEGRDKKKAPFEKIVEFKRASLSGNEHSALPSCLECQDKEERDTTKVPFENIVKVERASPTDNQHSLLQDEEGRDTTKAEPDKGSMQSGEAQVVETATNDESSNQFMDRKIVKKIVYHHPIEANKPNGALDDRQISVSLPKKKIKKKTSLPILEMDLSKSHRDPNDSAGKDDLSITDSHSIESCTEAVASSPFTSSHLRNMKLGDLRNFAQKLNIKPYSKLRKDDLIEHIANHLGCC